MSARGKYTSKRSSTIKIHGLDTNRRPLENNMKILQVLEGRKIILHTILLGVGGSTYTPHTLNHLN